MIKPENNTYPIVSIQTTYKCNMQCANCYLGDMLNNDEYADLNIDMFEKAISKLPKRIDVRFIGAEPTMNDDLFEMIKIVKKYKHRPQILTNGLKLGQEDYVIKLKESGINFLGLTRAKILFYWSLDEDAPIYFKMNIFRNAVSKFGIFLSFQTQINNNDADAGGGQYTYIAIRRGSLFPPEAATDVFGMYQISGYNTLPTFLSPNGPDPANETLPIDFAFYKYTTGTEDWWTGARLIQGKALRLNTLDSEITSNAQTFDFMNGWGTSQIGSSTPYRSWMWKRAPGYFDFVTYLGNGTAGRTVSHNLGVVPEMMWVKKSSSGSTRNWYVYHSGNYDQGSGSGAAHGYVVLNTSDAFEDQNFSWNVRMHRYFLLIVALPI